MHHKEILYPKLVAPQAWKVDDKLERWVHFFFFFWKRRSIWATPLEKIKEKETDKYLKLNASLTCP